MVQHSVNYHASFNRLLCNHPFQQKLSFIIQRDLISALLSIPNRYGMMCCSSLKLIRRIYHFMLCILHWKRELCQIKGVSLSIKGKLQIIWKMNWFLKDSKQLVILHLWLYFEIKFIAAILTKSITKSIMFWNIAANAPTWSKSI